MATPASWPAISATPRIEVKREPVQEARLDVLGEIGARIHRREESALDERDREREGEEGVGREAGQLRRRLQAARVHEQQHHREDQGEDDRRRLAARADDRAPRERADLCEDVAHAAGSAASGSASAAPSSERPVLARKTSSSDGAWISRLASVRPASSTARTTAGSPASPSRSRTTTSREFAAERLAVGSERGGEPLAIGLVGRDRVHARQPDLGLERGRRALGDDVPVVDDPDPVGEHVGLLEVLRGQEDGDAVLAGEPRDLVPESRAALDVEPGRRLVEEEDPRPVHERQRQVEPALHPARVAADLAIGRLAQADAVEELLRTRLPLGPRDPLQRRLQAQVVASRQHRVERRLLERRADHRAHLRALLDDVVAADAGRARRWAAAASSASGRSSTCRRRSARGSRRSRPARRAGRSRRPRAGPS